MTAHPRPKFTFVGHATVLCELPGGEVVLIDPWVQGNPACPQALKKLDRIDAVLITHAHFDHIGDAVALCKEHRPKKIVASFETTDRISMFSWLSFCGIAFLLW